MTMMRIQSQIDTVILSLGSAPTLRRVDPYLQGVLGLRRERHGSRLGERYQAGSTSSTESWKLAPVSG